MTIAVVNFIADPRLGGGTAVKSVALAGALASSGVETRFVTTDVGLGDRLVPELPKVDVTVIPTFFARFPIPRIGRTGMARLLSGCDAVIIVNHWNLLNAVAYRAARRIRVPFLFCPAGALRIQGRSQLLKHVFEYAIGRRLVAEAAALIATTELEAEQFRHAGIQADRIRVIPNGVDTHPTGWSSDELRARKGLPQGPLLLFMGRLNGIKGPDLLLEAFIVVADRFPPWHLVLAGRDEGLEPALRARAAAAGLAGRVHFLGHLEAIQAVGAYRAASLLVVPSRHEAMSLVALEAAVTGTPVLLTDVCGFDDVEGVGGGRVVGATVSALAAGLDSLLTDPAGLPAMGERLRELVLSRFGWPTVVQQYVALVRDVRARAGA